ncbi:VOC family protein [Naumannella sp. ID2617S]|nr:VOC family protein [Naumannella sp. ID2617S]
MPRLSAIAFDCRDVAAQSQFWSALLDRPIDEGASPYFASIGGHNGSADGPGMLFLGVHGEREAAKNPVHLDLFDLDLPTAVDRAVELGAERVADFDEYDVEWVTLRDPEGNLFDIGRPSSKQG